jgi:Rieske Fe-S protein
LEDPRGDQQPQLPPPSLWPVGFAVGIVCLLVGLVVSWVAAAVGAGIAIVFGFLWARDVVSGRAAARPPAEEVAAPTDGAEQPERFPRNKFLEGATLGLGAVIGGIVTLPVLGFAVLPGFTKQSASEIDLGPIENFPEGQYIVATFTSEKDQGPISRRTAFIRNNGSLRNKPSFTCISNRCVHLGCPVQAGGPVFDDQTKEVREAELTPALPAAGFICPCHGGAYDQEGNRTAGPPVRALNRYEFAIRNGHLILLDLFAVAYVNGSGANAKIKRYELAGPGQHVDGPEAWFYPIQAPH